MFYIEKIIVKIIRRENTLIRETGIRLHIEPLSRGELRNRKIIRRENTLIRANRDLVAYQTVMLRRIAKPFRLYEEKLQ